MGTMQIPEVSVEMKARPLAPLGTRLELVIADPRPVGCLRFRLCNVPGESQHPGRLPI
jgi:hypothetical protein